MTLTADGKALDEWLSPVLDDTVAIPDPGDVVEWAEDRFYVAPQKRPIQLEAVQKRGLRLASERLPSGRFRWSNILWATIKKSGKTTIAALYQRWAAEMWEEFGEVYHMGNKRDQAKDRAFKITKMSIEMAPMHEQVDWDIQTLKMSYAPKKSFIEAMPVNPTGSAGGNQELTTWTEFHGYIYEDNNRMFTEMQPVPTRLLSQRFMETYAGYMDQSILLWDFWQLGLEGELLDDEFPFYGNEAASLFAYIDVGEEARRMPWQQGEEGRRYYAMQRKVELPHEFDRIHMNFWAQSQVALIDITEWDRLQVDEIPKPERGDVVVVAADASMSDDCTALVVVWMKRRQGGGAVPTPSAPSAEGSGVALNAATSADDAGRLAALVEDDELAGEAGMMCYVLEVHVWYPPQNGKIDYDETIKSTLEEILKRYRVNVVAYDVWQLHDVMSGMDKKYRGKGVKFREFSQDSERLVADTNLVKRIRQERLAHRGEPDLREHLQNAAGKVNVSENKVRIVKKHQTKKVDAAVTLSMAVDVAFEIAQKPKASVFS